MILDGLCRLLVRVEPDVGLSVSASILALDGVYSLIFRVEGIVSMLCHGHLLLVGVVASPR